jgi:PAS domain-containing protein
MKRLPRIVVGLDGRIALVNESAQDLLGFAEQELIGVAMEALLEEREREAHVRARNAFLAEPTYDEGPLAPGRSTLLGRGGEVLASLWPQPLVGDNGLWLSLTVRPELALAR